MQELAAFNVPDSDRGLIGRREPMNGSQDLAVAGQVRPAPDGAAAGMVERALLRAAGGVYEMEHVFEVAQHENPRVIAETHYLHGDRPVQRPAPDAFARCWVPKGKGERFADH